MFASKGRGVLLLEGDSLLFPHAVACENSTNPPYLVTFILLKDALIWKALPCGVYGSRDSPCILRAGGLYTLAGFSVPTFSAGDGKPACLPSRTKLEQEPSLWRGNYDESCASLMNRTADMLFDIERSAAHADWVRTQLEEFYGINK